ncbi:basic proline-rich protein-like [Eubalaena glacialis]|uniref:basic proline-rich protein-like n=1 Tax=Eubalaena glacialis TaxID=27606 RepID=UPI002A5A1D9D|nr:basic proline-rich protein-like [Eubalaena glacialis]
MWMLNPHEEHHQEVSNPEDQPPGKAEGRGRVPLCHPPGSSHRRGRAEGTPAARWHPRQRPPPRPAVGRRGRDCSRRSGSRVRRCQRAGWDGRKRGKGAAGRGRREGTRAEPAARVPGGERRVQGAARSPEAPELRLLLPGCPGPGGRLSRLSRGSPVPPAAPSSGQDPRATQLPPPAPRSVGSGRPTRTSCRQSAGIIVRRAPPTSTAQAASAPTPGLRAPQLRVPGGRGRGGSGCACGGDARLLIPAGGGGGGGGADARAGLAVAGRGPSHQRWRGEEGRAEQAGWVGSGLRVAMAASTPGRAPLARGGAAQSGRRPRPRPARQPSARSPAPAPAPPPPDRQAGSEGRRAPPRAGPSAGGSPGAAQPEPRGQRESHSPLQRPRPRPACRRAPPRSAPPRGQVRRGAARPSAPPRPGEPTSDPRLTWSYGRSRSLRSAPRGRAPEAPRSALRHQGRASPASVVESELRQRETGARATPGAAGGGSVARTLQVAVEVVQGGAPPGCPPRTLRCRADSGASQGPASTTPSPGPQERASGTTLGYEGLNPRGAVVTSPPPAAAPRPPPPANPPTIPTPTLPLRGQEQCPAGGRSEIAGSCRFTTSIPLSSAPALALSPPRCGWARCTWREKDARQKVRNESDPLLDAEASGHPPLTAADPRTLVVLRLREVFNLQPGGRFLGRGHD